MDCVTVQAKNLYTMVICSFEIECFAYPFLSIMYSTSIAYKQAFSARSIDFYRFLSQDF